MFVQCLDTVELCGPEGEDLRFSFTLKIRAVFIWVLDDKKRNPGNHPTYTKH